MPATLRAGHDALRIAFFVGLRGFAAGAASGGGRDRPTLVVFDRLRKVESSSLLALLAPRPGAARGG
ncbi:MAG: hypothetical protein MUE73_15475, partial [Planctomycetes bacterium]|nr:hypothetical protein [Planctomycetota bacterium]